MNDPKANLERTEIKHLNANRQERRQTARFLLRDVRGSMSWERDGDGTACEVSVLNISGWGAAVLSEEAPQVGQSLRLRLHCESLPIGPVEAVAVSATDDASGKKMVRLRFAGWLPLESLQGKQPERRLWERYPARESRATLTWIDRDGETTVRGDLLNISGGGAAFVSEQLPPPGVPVWLQLEASVRQVESVHPVESKLVYTSLDPSGMKIAHLQFVIPCPMELFELAVNGGE